MVFMPMDSAQPSSRSMRCGIEGVGLPHFELVDGVGGDVVAADEPGLMRVPGVGLGFGPALARLGECGEGEKYEKWNGESREGPRFHRGYRI